MTAMVKLISSDSQVFEVPRDVATMIPIISPLLDDHGDEDDGAEKERNPIPLMEVTGTILKKVLEWCAEHKGEVPPEEPTGNQRPTSDIPQWDQTFLDVTSSELFELILAATYLDIKGLLGVCCQAVANMIKGKTPQQMRQCFNLQPKFTSEEEEQIRRENTWAED